MTFARVAFARSATARIPIACDLTAVDCAADNVDAAGVPELVEVEDCFAERSGLREEKQADFAPDPCGSRLLGASRDSPRAFDA